MIEQLPNWNQVNSLNDYSGQINNAYQRLGSRLVLPDQGFDAYKVLTALAVMGGNHNITALIGKAGTGKTQAAVILAGSNALVSVQSMDTEASLYGHTNPINGKEEIKGKATAPLERGHLILNEFTQAPNAEALNKLSDDLSILIGQRAIDLAGVTILLTSNFPDRESFRVNKPDKAQLSRIGMTIIPNITPEIAAKIQNPRRKGNKGKEHFMGLLPDSSQKAQLRDIAYNGFNIPEDQKFGEYIVTLIERLNDLQIDGKYVFGEIENSDGRIGEAFYNVAIAARLGHGAVEGSLTVADYSRVAALTLSHRLQLNEFLDLSTIGKRLGRSGYPSEEQVARLAKVVTSVFAAKVAHDMSAAADPSISSTIETARLNKFADEYSGVNDGSRSYQQMRELSVGLVQ